MKTNFSHSCLVIIYLSSLFKFVQYYYYVYFLVKASLNTNWVRENSQNFITHLEIKTKTIQVGLKYKRVERINMGGGSV